MQNDIKKVYIVIQNSFNGCDNFESIESVWGDANDAWLRCMELEENNTDSDLSFWYMPLDVK